MPPLSRGHSAAVSALRCGDKETALLSRGCWVASDLRERRDGKLPGLAPEGTPERGLKVALASLLSRSCQSLAKTPGCGNKETRGGRAAT